MIKKMCSILLVISGLRAADSSQDTLPCFQGNAYMLYKSNWHMMEDIFIVQPEEKVSRIIGMGGLIGLTTVGVATLAYFGANKAINYLNGQRIGPNGVIQPTRPPYPFLGTRKNVIAVGTGILSGIIFYNTANSILREREEIKQLKRLLKQWPEVKDLCPRELHAPLAKLVQEHNTSQLRETVRLVKTLIHSHFPQKYGQKKGFFTQGKVNFNMNLDLTRVFDRIYQFFMA